MGGVVKFVYIFLGLFFDTGAGMGEKVRLKAFDLFSTQPEREGAGMGLSVIHGIVKDHGGIV